MSARALPPLVGMFCRVQLLVDQRAPVLGHIGQEHTELTVLCPLGGTRMLALDACDFSPFLHQGWHSRKRQLPTNRASPP